MEVEDAVSRASLFSQETFFQLTAGSKQWRVWIEPYWRVVGGGGSGSIVESGWREKGGGEAFLHFHRREEDQDRQVVSKRWWRTDMIWFR